MKNAILLITIFCWGCCHYAGNEVTEIKENDKQLFPYNANRNIIYKLPGTPTFDTLVVSELDTSVQDVGIECAEYEEHRSCTLQSGRLKDISIEIKLEPKILYINIYDLNLHKGDSYAYDFGKSGYVLNKTVKIIDSIEINKVLYRKVLYVSDTAIDLSLYYNYKGIMRYINKNDTFDLAD